ncbi:hypothetical protein ACFL6F_01095 [Planctomycetota bacterium]
MSADPSKYTHLLIVLLIILSPLTYGLTQAEKALGNKFAAALSRKSYRDLDGLVPRLKDSEISDSFRLKYCKRLLATNLTRSLSKKSIDGSIDILIHMYNNNSKDPKTQKNIVQIVSIGLSRIRSETHVCTSLLRFFNEVEEPGTALARIRVLLKRFQEEAEVLNAVFDALENQRVRESVDVVNSIYFQIYKKAGYAGKEKDTKRPSLLLKDKYGSKSGNVKYMMLFSKTSAKAKNTLYSLTGFRADKPGLFNQWWLGRRYTFKVKGKKEIEEQENPKEDDKEPPLELKINMPPNPNEQFWNKLEKGAMDRQFLNGGEDEDAVIKEAAPRGCRTIRTKHFLIISDLKEKELQDLGKKVEILYGHYEKQFGVSVDPRKMLRYYNMRRGMYGKPLRKTETMKIACFTSGSNYGTFVRRFFGGSIEGGQGFTSTEHNICVFRRVGRSTLSFEGTLAHECTHLFASAAYCRVAKGNIPLWLSEGGATYNETIQIKDGKTESAGFVNRNRLSNAGKRSLSIENIIKGSLADATGSGGDAFYGNAWALYHFFHHGPEIYRKRFKQLEHAMYRAYFPRPEDCPRHSLRMFKQIFGSDLKAMNNDFRAYVMGLK